MHPRGDYPILNLRGEQGARKTTLTVMLRNIIDANEAPVRKMPKEEESLAMAAKNGRIIAIDNLSWLPDWLSDDLCCMSTGYGSSRRTLYEDSRETIYQFARPVVINGITEIVTRGDLLDRLISIDLPSPDGGFKEKQQIQSEFESEHSKILGALLDAVSVAMKGKDAIKDNLAAQHIEKLRTIRLNDFAVWVEAAAPALGWESGHFIDMYATQREEISSIEIEASSLALAILKYLEKNKNFGVKRDDGTEIKGVSADALLPCLWDIHTDKGARKPSKDWPDTGLKLGQQLKRLIPAFRKIGWELTQPRVDAGRRGWRCTLVQKSDGSEETNRQKEGPTVRKRAQPSAQPSRVIPLNSDNLSEIGPGTDGSDSLFPYSSVRQLNEIKEKESLSPPIDTHIEGVRNRPSEPSEPSEPSDGDAPHSIDPLPMNLTPGCPHEDVTWDEDSMIWVCPDCGERVEGATEYIE